MKRTGYLISNIVTGLLKAAAIVGAVLWLLPRWGINIPVWGLALLLVALVAYEVVTFRMGLRALDKKPVVSTQAMVGCHGRTTIPLTPGGYVQVGSELWRALSTGPNMDEDEEVVVIEVKRLTLFVAPLPDEKETCIQLEPELSACIETKARREYQKTVNELLEKDDSEELQEKAELLRLFLESTNFGKLRSQYEQYLVQGKKVRFILYWQQGKPEYEMQII